MPSKIVRIDSILKQTKSSANSIRRSTNKKRTSVEGTLDRTQAPQLLTDATGTEPAVIKPEPDSNLNLQGAINHLCTVDPRFHALFQRFTPQPWTESGLAQPKNHFKSLVLGVLSQQVSGAAARSIGRRFVHLFVDPIHEVKLEVDIDPEVEDGPARLSDTVEVEDQVESMTNAVPANEALEDAYFPTPEQVAASEILYLKTAGLSLRKAEYVYGIANAFVSGSLNDDFFDTADDEAIKERLVSIRGLGPWSAEMFMVRFDHLPLTSEKHHIDYLDVLFEAMGYNFAWRYRYTKSKQVAVCP